jgi:S-adenosylmethionine-diacylglycerol 3-amino-3-carboxypropyl transferase
MILNRTKHALTKIPTHSNPYLSYILTGNFSRSLPHYLKPEHFESIKKNLPNLELQHCGVSEAMDLYPNRFTRFNLSDIFEYMSGDEFEQISAQLFSNSGKDAKVAYWNLLAQRNLNSFSEYWKTDEQLSEELHRQDKAWFYSKFFISEKRV